MPVEGFPNNFAFGVATAAYQIEGGWDAEGKGESVFDHDLHKDPTWSVNGSNGDNACESYRLFQKDVDACTELGVDFYRFSFSWPRILPTGKTDKVNKAGVDYYHRLIDALVARGIRPMVTLFHWDMPQALQAEGGWLSPKSIEWFTDYAQLCFAEFGSKVSDWITLNEPWVVAWFAHGSRKLPPGVDGDPRAPYTAAHHMLLAHATAYHLYKERYSGNVSITLNQSWMEPANDEPETIEVAERAVEMELGWFAQPIFIGDYSPVLKARMEALRETEHSETSRLPTFTPAQVALVKGTSDFLGLNYYNAYLAELLDTGDQRAMETASKRSRDVGISTRVDPSWDTMNFVTQTPWAFRKLLAWIRAKYDNPRLFVWENGSCDPVDGDAVIMDDVHRVRYLNDHLITLRDAITGGQRIEGYTVWSLLDNYEWTWGGYDMKFGLYAVDFEDPERKRTPKKAALWYRDVLSGVVKLGT